MHVGDCFPLPREHDNVAGTGGRHGAIPRLSLFFVISMAYVQNRFDSPVSTTL